MGFGMETRDILSTGKLGKGYVKKGHTEECWGLSSSILFLSAALNGEYVCIRMNLPESKFVAGE